jgi:hypothetical protein
VVVCASFRAVGFLTHVSFAVVASFLAGLDGNM